MANELVKCPGCQEDVTAAELKQFGGVCKACYETLEDLKMLECQMHLDSVKYMGDEI